MWALQRCVKSSFLAVHFIWSSNQSELNGVSNFIELLQCLSVKLDKMENAQNNKPHSEESVSELVLPKKKIAASFYGFWSGLRPFSVAHNRFSSIDRSCIWFFVQYEWADTSNVVWKNSTERDNAVAEETFVIQDKHFTPVHKNTAMKISTHIVRGANDHSYTTNTIV